MTIMNAKQVRDAAARSEPYMSQAYTETNDYAPRSIVWIVVAVAVVVGICLLFVWFHDFVGLTDAIAATAATVEALP